MRLAAEEGAFEQLPIDATHLKARRTAASQLEKEMFPAVLAGQKSD